MSLELSSYPKVYNIGHAAISGMFSEPVLVEEKIDGSQFTFLKDDAGELRFYSKNARIMPEVAGMFKQGVDAISELKDDIKTGWIYRGEYLQKPKHNVLCYNRVPNRHVILFDIGTGIETYLSRADKEDEARHLGLEIVPVLAKHLYVGTPEDLLTLLESESILGGQKVEGIVAKNYERFSKDGKAMFGKFVREDFKETANKEWKANNPNLSDIVDRIILTLKSEKRWEKAIFHLRDEGKLENSPRDIGPLLKEIQKDIAEEEYEFIQKKLADWALPRICRASTAGFPEWYKERLLKSAFSSETEMAGG